MREGANQATNCNPVSAKYFVLLRDLLRLFLTIPQEFDDHGRGDPCPFLPPYNSFNPDYSAAMLVTPPG